MLMAVVQTRTKDWQMLMQIVEQAANACPTQIVKRCAVYRNAQNAANAWLLIESGESCTDSELQRWLEDLIVNLNEKHVEHAVLECIMQMK